MFYSNNVEFDSESGLFQNIHKVHVAGFRCQIQKDENNSCNFVFLVPQYSKIIAFDLKILALSLSLFRLLNWQISKIQFQDKIFCLIVGFVMIAVMKTICFLLSVIRMII